MKKSSFIYFASMGLVPIGLINIRNFNLFNVLVLCFYLTQIPFAVRISLKHNNSYFTASKVVLFLVITVFLSYLNMIFGLGKITDWTVLYSLNYMLFWILIRDLRSFKDIDKLFHLLGIFSLICILWLTLFYLFPWILEGPFKGIRMGSVRKDVLGATRIFTPRMEYINVFIIYLMSYLYIGKPKNRLILLLLLFISLFTIIIFTSVRSYIASLVVLFIILVVLNRRIGTLLKIATGVAVLGFLFYIIPGPIRQYIVERMEPIFQIRNLNIVSAFKGTIEYGTEKGNIFDTVYWRILEVPYALSYIDTKAKILFGTIGQLYDYRGVFDNPAPHISIIGIYYLFGISGILSFSIFIIYFSIKIIKLYNKYKRHPRRYLATFILLAWLGMFMLSFLGGIYYSNSVTIVIGLCALSIIMEHLYKKEKNLGYA